MRRVDVFCLEFGAVLLACYVCLFVVLMPVDLAPSHFSTLVRHPAWMPLAGLAIAGLCLLTVGFLAIMRALDLQPLPLALAQAVLALAVVLNIANLTWEAFVFPALAHNATTVFVLDDGLIRDFAAVKAFHLTRIVLSGLALAMFAHGMWGATRAATAGGVLTALGLGAFTFETMLPPSLVMAGAAALCCGALMLGRHMPAAQMGPR